MARYLGLDSTEETQKVHKLDTVHELRLVIETNDLAAVLRNSSEGDNTVEIESQHCVRSRSAWFIMAMQHAVIS